jgi:hypothetical protein
VAALAAALLATPGNAAPTHYVRMSDALEICLLMPLRRHYSNPEIRQAIELLHRQLPET